jgi:hypothetical protein
MTCGCVNQAYTDPIPILSGPARSDSELVDPAILEVNDNGGRFRLLSGLNAGWLPNFSRALSHSCTSRRKDGVTS